MTENKHECDFIPVKIYTISENLYGDISKFVIVKCICQVDDCDKTAFVVAIEDEL